MRIFLGPDQARTSSRSLPSEPTGPPVPPLEDAATAETAPPVDEVDCRKPIAEGSDPNRLAAQLRLPAAIVAGGGGGLASMTLALVWEREVVGGRWQPEGKARIAGRVSLHNASISPAAKGVRMPLRVGLPPGTQGPEVTYLDPRTKTVQPGRDLAEAVETAPKLEGNDAHLHVSFSLPEETLSHLGATTFALIPNDGIDSEGKVSGDALKGVVLPAVEGVNQQVAVPQGSPSIEVLTDIGDLNYGALATQQGRLAVGITRAFDETLSESVLEDAGYTPTTAFETLSSQPGTTREKLRHHALGQVVNAGAGIASARHTIGWEPVEAAKVATATGHPADPSTLSEEAAAALDPLMQMLVGKANPFKAVDNIVVAGPNTTNATLDTYYFDNAAPNYVAACNQTGHADPTLALYALARKRAEALEQIPQFRRPHFQPDFMTRPVPHEYLTLADLKAQSDALLKPKSEGGPVVRFCQWVARKAANHLSAQMVPLAAVALGSGWSDDHEAKVNRALGDMIDQASKGEESFSNWIAERTANNSPAPSPAAPAPPGPVETTQEVPLIQTNPARAQAEFAKRTQALEAQLQPVLQEPGFQEKFQGEIQTRYEAVAKSGLAGRVLNHHWANAGGAVLQAQAQQKGVQVDQLSEQDQLETQRLLSQQVEGQIRLILAAQVVKEHADTTENHALAKAAGHLLKGYPELLGDPLPEAVRQVTAKPNETEKA